MSRTEFDLGNGAFGGVAAVGDSPLVVEIVEDGANEADDTASLG